MFGKPLPAVTARNGRRLKPALQAEARAIRHSRSGTALLPGFGRQAVVYALHGDAVFYGADQGAEVAAYAFGFVYCWDSDGARHWAV